MCLQAVDRFQKDLMCRLMPGVLCCMLFFTHARAQHAVEEVALRHRIMFYNVENLFDTEDDSLTLDEEYLPGGLRGWSNYKFQQKCRHIYKTIAGVGGWNPPALVAMAEVENKKVLEKLIQQTPLHRFQYQVVHQESPDERGIDVALLYRSDQFRVLSQQAWPLVFPFDAENSTRDLLYVKGLLQEQDTLHLVVCHWPSRRGGASASEKYRLYAARLLKSKVDSLMQQQPEANVVLTGDFNDNPGDSSLMLLTDSGEHALVNISHHMVPGTLKHEAEWSVFDQFVVSPALLNSDHRCRLKEPQARVFAPDWLLEKDQKFAGFKPKRTYVGYQYQEGFSDHLPVYIDIVINQQL